MHRFVSALIAVVILTMPFQSEASPWLINYQGKLLQASKEPVPDGAYTIKFGIYSGVVGGAALWTETVEQVQIRGGLYSVLLGNSVPINPSLFNSDDTFLGLTVNSDPEMVPRQKLAAVPYSFISGTVADGAIGSAKLSSDPLSIGRMTGNLIRIDGGATYVSGGLNVGGTLTAASASVPGSLGVGGTLTAASANVPGSLGVGGTLTAANVNVPGGTLSVGVAASQGMVNAPGRLLIQSGPAEDLYLNPASGIVYVGGGAGPGSLEVRGTLTAAQANVPGSVASGQIELVSPTPFIDFHYGSLANQDYNVRVINDGNLILSVRGSNGAAATFSVEGNLVVSGSKSSVADTADYGKRLMYAVEAPDNRFSDEGVATLQSGKARVELDPMFVQTIEGQFVVHITPYGDSALYVSERGSNFFTVKARPGEQDVEFAWRLSAKRKGHADVRMEKFEQ